MWRFITLFAVIRSATSLRTVANCGERNGVGEGEALHLTPYVESGNIEDARNAARVHPILENITSYSGYLTVNEDFDSNLFFWFFPAEESPETAPVAVWLQGGPGSSSMFAVFKENGPFVFDGASGVKKRSAYWSQKLNMIFIDQPVGTGFSYTKSPKGYASNEDDVSRDVYAALLQFFKLFPEYENNDFYLTGESYAGKYIPSVGSRIHQLNPNASQKINLKGIAIGNGWVDPYSMIDYSTLLYDLDFIDEKTRDDFAGIEDEIRVQISNQNYTQANSLFGSYFDYKVSMVSNVTGIQNVYNYLALQDKNDDDMIAYLNQSEIRHDIHVGNYTFTSSSGVVYKYLYLDNLVSTIDKLEMLMDNYRVLLYSGQLDIICAYTLTMNYVRKLKWKGAEEYRNATRLKWYVGKDLAGYSKTAGNFTELLVRDAGHMVPGDQPIWALDMITKFAFNRPLRNDPGQPDCW